MTDLAFPKVTGRSTRQRKRQRDDDAAAFRAKVWVRDDGKDRATGQILRLPSRALHLDECGEVCHFKGRRVRPEWRTDPRRAVLLSSRNHILSDHRGGNLLKMTDPETGEPATDAGLDKPRLIRFTLYDRQGNVKWTRIG